MVDWDRVEELRSKGWDWDEIADDPKVGFHPDTSVQEPGRALRGLYHRQRSRQSRKSEVTAPAAPTKEEKEKDERKWRLARIGYLLVPIFGLWFLFAYFIPSPVGIVLPAIPYLALGLVIGAFLLLYGLLRSTAPRWSTVYRNTLVVGIVLGLVISGIIALGGVLFFHCPVLQSASAGTSQPPAGWMSYNNPTWQESGNPVLYFYGATWCPYCSASSWAIWKAMSGFGTVSGVNSNSFYLSAEDQIPGVDLSGASVASTNPGVAFVVSEDTSGTQGTFPATSDCTQQAYVSAYSDSSIPFVAINGQYIHGGSSLEDPTNIKNVGLSTMQTDVSSATGQGWAIVQDQTWWMMAFIAKAGGATTSNLAQQPYYSAWATQSVWGSNTQSSVAADLGQIH